jgi:hypothetical protein
MIEEAQDPEEHEDQDGLDPESSGEGDGTDMEQVIRIKGMYNEYFLDYASYVIPSGPFRTCTMA